MGNSIPYTVYTSPQTYSLLICWWKTRHSSHKGLRFAIFSIRAGVTWYNPSPDCVINHKSAGFSILRVNKHSFRVTVTAIHTGQGGCQGQMCIPSRSSVQKQTMTPTDAGQRWWSWAADEGFIWDVSKQLQHLKKCKFRDQMSLLVLWVKTGGWRLLLSKQILAKVSTQNISFLALFDGDRAGGGYGGTMQDYAPRVDHIKASLRIKIQAEY